MKSEFQLNKKVTILCFFASCLEIYNFTIFAFFAHIFYKDYFTYLDHETMLIYTYLLFAIGFIFRPIGALIFGYIGDVYGRKKALVASLALMAICALIMFLLPTYKMAGITSCYIIVLVRIMQGLSVGGEFMGALIFAIEYNRGKNIGVIGGIMSASGAGGILLAITLSKIFEQSLFQGASWRLAFLLGFSLFFICYFIGAKLTETPSFIKFKSERKGIPIIRGLKVFKFNALLTTLIAAANGASLYFAVMFFPNYLGKITTVETKFLPLLITCFILIFAPLVGYLSERTDKKMLMMIACLLMVFYVPVVTLLLVRENSLFCTIIFMGIYCLIFSTISSMSNIISVEMFPPEIRVSCTSFFYSIGMGAIGGTTPSVLVSVEKNFGTDPIYTGLYISLVCFMAFLGLLFSTRIKSPLT